MHARLELLVALLRAYGQRRAFTRGEHAAWNDTLRAAALRFWTSRLHDVLRPRSAHELTPHDSLSARYSLYHVDSQNSRGAGGLSYTSAAAALYDLDQTLAISNIAWLASTGK